MSLDKETIVHLQNTANIDRVQEDLANKGAKVPLFAAPADFKIHDLEEYMEFRTFYRGDFTTHSMPDFVDYNTEFQQPESKCFIDVDRMFARTIFDVGTVEKPLHRKHTSNFNLKKTAAYEALLQACSGRQLSQKGLSDFLEDWGDLYIAINTSEGEDISIGVSSTLIRDLTIERANQARSSVKQFSEEMSGMERIEAKGADKLPANISFKCVPYVGLCERVFTLKVSILTGGDKPAFTLRNVREDLINEDMGIEFKGMVQDSLKGTSIKTLIGG